MQLFLHPTPISGSYSSDFAYRLKSSFLPRGSFVFFEILDLSTPNTREKYLLKTNCLDFFSLWATAVDRCEIGILNVRDKVFRDLLPSPPVGMGEAEEEDEMR